MKPKFMLLLTILFYSLGSYAQKHSTNFKIGVSYYFPAYTSTFGDNHTNGLGSEIRIDHFVSNHFSISASSGFLHFDGYITTFNREYVDFNSIPLFIGCRYHLNKFFLGMETGPLISTSKSISTHNTLSPSLGIKMNKIEAEMRLMNILGMASIPENSFLTSGGYGYFNLKLSYSLFQNN